MAFVQRLANQQKSQNICVSRWAVWTTLQTLFKEQHKALLETLRDSVVLATADLQHILQTFLELRSHVNKHTDKQYGRTRETPTKKSARKKYAKHAAPLLRHLKRLFLELAQKHNKSWSAFVLIRVLVLLMQTENGNNMYLLTEWEGRTEKYWLEVRAYGPRCARSVPPDREPNIFPSGPTLLSQ